MNRPSSPNVRNTVRGIISAKDNDTLKRTLNSLRTSFTPAEIYEAYKYLITAREAKGFEPPSSFPKSPMEYRLNIQLAPTTFMREYAIQQARIEDSTEMVRAFFELFGNLSTAALSEDVNSIPGLIDRLRSEFGFSLTLLKRVLSIKHLYSDDRTIQASVQRYVSEYNVKGRDFIAVAFDDSINLETNYSYIRQTFMRHIDNDGIKSAVHQVVLDFFEPTINIQEEASLRLQANAFFSLIDSVDFLMTRNDDIVAVLDAASGRHLLETIPAKIITTWREAHERFSPHIFNKVYGTDPRFLESNFLRHTSAWSGYTEVRRYRSWIEDAIGHRLSGRYTPSRSAMVKGNPFRTSLGIPALALTPITAPLEIINIQPQNCGCLHRTAALLVLMEGEIGKCDLSGDDLLKLLDKTMDIARLASENEINTFIVSNEGDRLHAYLKAALLYDSTESEINLHRLRKFTQNTVKELFGGNVSEFADFLYRSGEHVGHHFYYTADEQFLVQCYDLFDTGNDVSEARAQLLEWYSEKTGDTQLTARAKSLRLDAKLRAVRGDIDDNRIYMDSSRFLQWLADNVASELRTVIPLLAINKPEVAGELELANEINRMQKPQLHLAHILERSYKEFCTNKFFGVDSYIGRRIRHGTLEGVMVSGVRHEIDSLIGQLDGSHPKAVSFLLNWLDSYSAEIEKLGSQSFYFKSEDRPKALLNPTIGTSDKAATANLAIKDISVALGAEVGTRYALGQILVYCWIILEIDLKLVRQELIVLRQKLVLDLDRIPIDIGSNHSALVVQSVQTINGILIQRFASLAEWCSKPTNVSPSATLSLLFNAVFIEANEMFMDRKATKVESGQNETGLIGDGYHYVYDILYALVVNAVKYGKHEGVVRFHVEEHQSAPDRLKFQMSISSTCDVDKVVSLLASVNAAMTADIGEALTQRGFSGLRKVRAMMQDHDDLISFHFNNDGCEFHFHVLVELNRT